MNAELWAKYSQVLQSDFPLFVERSVAELNPGTSWERNWHIDAIAHQLQRVERGEITRLIINAPPRSAKSIAGSVCWPAHVLARNHSVKFVCASYSDDLAVVHASHFRRLVSADWYRNAFKSQPLRKNSANEVETMQGGSRYATSVDGTLTGLGADVIIVDDPLNAKDAFSKVSRDHVNEWFDHSLVSRLNNKITGAIVVIMQRLHPEDLTGHLLRKGGWQHLCLPAIAPADADIPTGNGGLRNWTEGQPLQANREPTHVLDNLKQQLGSEIFNAQYLQAPLPEQGNMLKRDWLKMYGAVPIRQAGDEIFQSWDTASKATKTCDFSVCATFLVRNKNQYFLLDLYRERLEFPELSSLVVSHARKHQAGAVLIEDSASGIQLIQTARRAGLQGVIEIRHTKDKETRMRNQTPQLAAGSLLLPQIAPWLNEFIAEYVAFPSSRYDDQIDALSQFLEWQDARHHKCTFEWEWM